MTADELIARATPGAAPAGRRVGGRGDPALVRSARPGTEADDATKSIAWGPGPRASQALMLAVRARALLDGRLAPSIDDVVALAEPVLKHRMALTFAARAEGESVEAVIGRLKSRLRVIEWRSSQTLASSKQMRSAMPAASRARLPPVCRG